jgi:hypothetical protein
LLSVVAQDFALVIFIYLCAGEDLSPSSSHADDCYQWEIQTDEGYQWEIQTGEGSVPYWDSHV